MSSHAVFALTDTGHIVVAGSARDGMFKIPALPEGSSRFTAVDADERHGVALTDAGRVLVWGEAEEELAKALDLPEEAREKVFTQVAAGEDFSLALTDGGEVLAWGPGPGLGDGTAFDLPSGATTFVEVVAGGDMASALTDDGRVVTRGGTEAWANSHRSLRQRSTSTWLSGAPFWPV